MYVLYSECSSFPISKSKYVRLFFCSRFEENLLLAEYTADNFYETSIYYSEKCSKFHVLFFDRYPARHPLAKENILVYGFYAKWNCDFKVFKLYSEYYVHAICMQ